MSSIAFHRGWNQVLDNLPYRNPYENVNAILFHEFERGRMWANDYKETLQPLLYKLIYN